MTEQCQNQQQKIKLKSFVIKQRLHNFFFFSFEKLKFIENKFERNKRERNENRAPTGKMEPKKTVNKP